MCRSDGEGDGLAVCGDGELGRPANGTGDSLGDAKGFFSESKNLLIIIIIVCLQNLATSPDQLAEFLRCGLHLGSRDKKKIRELVVSMCSTHQPLFPLISIFFLSQVTNRLAAKILARLNLACRQNPQHVERHSPCAHTLM